MSSTSHRIAVIKVGGSLFHLPGLGDRISRFLGTLCGYSPLLVPGGGAMADEIRAMDKIHGIGEETSHWLALSALQLNAKLLAHLLPNGSVIENVCDAENCWQSGLIPILEMFRFACDDDTRPGALPHQWTVTSDSLAARVATVIDAQRLILLKSTSIAADRDWVAAAQNGFVDDHFPILAENASFAIEPVDLRSWCDPAVL